MILSVYITGTPRPQPRARFVDGRVVSTASRHAKLWKNLVISSLLAARKGLFIERPVGLWCDAMFPTPKSERWGKPHAIRPDKDNVEKLVMDALVKAGILKDDSLVCDGALRKLWAQRGGMSIVLLEAGQLPKVDADDLGAVALDA